MARRKKASQRNRPTCPVCGGAVDVPCVGRNGREYCSEKCMAEDFAVCETCGQSVSDPIVDDEGFEFCSNRCRDVDAECRAIADRARSGRMGAAGRAGHAASALKSSGLYAEQVAFQTGWRDGKGRRIQVGHGVAAEKGNHMIDALRSRKAKHVGGGNAKNGADRFVNGQSIQTKYHRTPSASVSSCFDSKNGGLYKYLDKRGKPMKVEVPRDQHRRAVAFMERKIRQGKVPNTTDPAKAKEIVSAGPLTHRQAKNLVRFGTLESVSFDSINGLRIGVQAFGISCIFAFAIAIWRGKSRREALEEAVAAGIQAGGVSFITTVGAAQLGRTCVETSLRGTSLRLANKLGPKMCWMLARAGGKKLGGAAARSHAAKIIRGNIVTGVVVTAVLSAKDIYRLSMDQISFGQAVKNVSTTAAGVAGGTAGAIYGMAKGAALGASLGSVVPGLGTVLGAKIGGVIGFVSGSCAGGAIAGVATNSALGLIIEDDAVALGKLFREVTSELAADFVLGEVELEELYGRINARDLTRLLGEMHASGNRRAYAASIVKPIIVDIVASRPPVSPPSPEELRRAMAE